MNSLQWTAIAIYGFLLLACIGLVIGSEFFGPTVRGTLLPAATEGLKLTIAALIGAASTLLGKSKK